MEWVHHMVQLTVGPCGAAFRGLIGVRATWLCTPTAQLHTATYTTHIKHTLRLTVQHTQKQVGH